MNTKHLFDRSISSKFWKQLLWLVGIAAFVFGFWSIISLFLFQHLPDSAFNKDIENRWWGLYSQFLDPGNIHQAKSDPQTTHPINSNIRLFIALVALSGSVVFGGLLISTFSNAFERRIDKIKAGRVRYNFSNHIIIIGYDHSAIHIIKSYTINNKPTKQIVLFTSQDAVEVRRHCFTFLDKNEEDRVCIYHGGRDSKEELETLRINRAGALYLLGEPIEAERDSRNLLCFQLMRDVFNELKPKQKFPLPLFLLLQNYKEYQLIQDFNLDPHEKKWIALKPVNYFEEWSRLALSDLNLCKPPHLPVKNPSFLPARYDELRINNEKNFNWF